jgi:hypothetical protein
MGGDEPGEMVEMRIRRKKEERERKPGFIVFLCLSAYSAC